MPTPLTLRLWLLLFAGAALSLGSGCISSSIKGTRCAVVLLVSGHQVRPTFAQFQAIDQALGPSMAQRGLVLIHEMHEAEMLATIELIPRQEDPSRTDLVVREVSKNDYVRTDDNRFSPSIIESIREHNEAFRGFTRPTD